MKKLPSLLALILALTLALALFPAGSGLAADPLPEPVQRVFDRTDKGVLENRPGFSWVWGPRVQDSLEDYVESPNGKRQVYYFEKGRLEITDPAKNPNDKYYVTSGLLLREMITGQQQVGNQALVERGPAQVPLAGDLTPGVPDSPTYASLINLVSFDGSWKSNDLTGQPVVRTLGLGGAVGTRAELAQGVYYAQYYKETGHNVAKPFVDFMNRRGPVYENGRYLTNQPVFDPLYVFGFPISEPYWAHVTVGGKEQFVLVQAFERRLLTYTPSNPEPYKVELGNLGLAYVQWRYKSAPVPFSNADPDYARPVETPGFKLYNDVNANMQTLTSVKRVLSGNGKVVSQEFYQAPDKARFLDATNYRGQPATLETIIVGRRTYQRLLSGGQATSWVYEDSPTPLVWPAGFKPFRVYSLNDWTKDWQAGEPNGSGPNVTRPLVVNYTNIDGSKVFEVRQVSETHKLILNATQEITLPENVKVAQAVNYADYNVPNSIAAPAGALPASDGGASGFQVREATLALPSTGSRATDALLRQEYAGQQWLDAMRLKAAGVLVKFKNGYRSQSAEVARSSGMLSLAQGWDAMPSDMPAFYRVSGGDLPAALDRLKADPRVEYAEPNYLRERYIAQFNDPQNADQYYLKAIRAPRAWDYTTGSKAITVAVIDSGVDLENPDLKGNIAETYNSMKNNTDVSDREGHGSWTTGIIAALGNNNVYGTGIAWNTRILAIRGDSDDEPGAFSDASVIKAIRYATDKGAKIINMSLGGPGDSRALRDAVAYATGKGVLVVASSGNSGTPTLNYPASYPKVISVGATGLLGLPAGFSSYGSRVTLSAPGVRMCNTVRAGQFACIDGTSASAPVVSAAAALVLAVNPELNPDQVKAILIAAATPAPGKNRGQRDEKYGYGQVDVATALRMAATNQLPPLPPDLPQ